MEFRTIVNIEKPPFEIEPCQPMLFIGSCFAENIGRRFEENRFPTTINPYGVMYNPTSVKHSVLRWLEEKRNEDTDFRKPLVVFLTLGTNHVYIDNETNTVVDNCQKRPHNQFTERELSVRECEEEIGSAVDALCRHFPDAHVVITVSPIRYAKYGYHVSQLSKATLLLAAQAVVDKRPGTATYFPAYEIVLDELRDYRFYQPDMLHPSPQAVDYMWERLVEQYFSASAKHFLDEWEPIKKALAHRPFNPDSGEYKRFIAEARIKEKELLARYGVKE